MSTHITSMGSETLATKINKFVNWDSLNFTYVRVLSGCISSSSVILKSNLSCHVCFKYYTFSVLIFFTLLIKKIQYILCLHRNRPHTSVRLKASFIDSCSFNSNGLYNIIIVFTISRKPYSR